MGGLATVLIGVPLTVSAVIGDRSLLPAAVMAGLAAGVMVTAAWQLLALVLDLLAGDLPGWRRSLLTAAFAVFALLMPFLMIAAVAPG